MTRSLRALGIVVAGLLLAAAGLYRPEIAPAELEASYAGPTSRFAEVAASRVHYRDEGSGPPLLLIHGTASSLHTWDGWAAVLAGRFRVVRLDLPGFGLTGPDRGHDHSAARRVEVIAALLDRLGIERCAVAGNSLGGAIALELALAHPGRVTELILIDSAGYPRRRSRGFVVLDLGRLPLADVLLARITPRFLVRRGLRQAYGDPARVTPELVDRTYRLLRRRGNRRALLAGLASEHRLSREAIRSIAQPTLILWGREDRLIAVELAEALHSDLRDSELVVYDDVGHVPMEEIPARSAADAARFLLAAAGDDS